MRYEVGSTAVFIHFVFSGAPGTVACDEWFFAKPIPWLHTINKVTVKSMACAEHHKVPSSYDPDGEKRYDGFTFRDEGGTTWYNQYPCASYGQLSDRADGIVERQIKSADDKMTEMDGPLMMYDAMRFLDELHHGIIVMKAQNAKDTVSLLEDHYSSVVQTIEKETGLTVSNEVLLEGHGLVRHFLMVAQ